VEGSSAPLGLIDGKKTVITFAMDITELKEKILLHQSKMAAMGEMIGNIAHQWRQPLVENVNYEYNAVKYKGPNLQ